MTSAEALLTAVVYLHGRLKPSGGELPLPVDAGRITSVYGVRRDPVHGKKRLHEGVDIAAPVGSAIRAVASGQVTFAGYHPGYGRVLAVRHGGGVTTLYAHCWAIKVAVGDWVKSGATLAYVGETGRATGAHLHFEVRVRGTSVDPLAVLRAQGGAMRPPR
jgi:murein DD-endopeptidase MepM/ murein hydrolase activator NlpD